MAAIAFILFSEPVFADYESGAVDIQCDKDNDLLVIRTYIKWNEDYDLFRKLHPYGRSVNKEHAVFLLDSISGENNHHANYECRIKNNQFTAEISRSGVFSVINNHKKPVYKFTDIYPSDDDIYGLSYTIKDYYLKISSDEKVIECITRTGQQQVCGEAIVNKIRSNPNQSPKAQPSAAGNSASGAP